MKIVFLIIVITIINSCAQEYKVSFIRTIDPQKGNTMYVGKVTEDAFIDTSMTWYLAEKKVYEIQREYFEDMIFDFSDVNFTVVLGTWCGDTHRELPRFIKIMQSLDFPMEKMELICVDRQKNGLENEVENLNIQLVPTFIFYKGSTEIGRIIEIPENTLEQDIVKLFLIIK